MKYVDFYGNKVSKLIVGDNPFNGHSYIASYFPREEMLAYYTEDKILEDIYKMEELGVNTMLPLADPYIIRILQHYRMNGGKMNFIFQSYAPLLFTEDSIKFSIDCMSKVDPIGIYLSGSTLDVRYETGRKQEVLDLIRCFRENTDVKFGIGTHHPEVIELSEKEGWDVDFYMACMYNLRRDREGQESGFLTGKSKVGITIVPGDRPLMLKALENVKKPIIAFKIFSGGQMLVETEEAERRALIKDTYNTIFNTLKPDDFAVMGVFQKYHDQLTENVSVFNEWAEGK